MSEHHLFIGLKVENNNYSWLHDVVTCSYMCIHCVGDDVNLPLIGRNLIVLD